MNILINRNHKHVENYSLAPIDNFSNLVPELHDIINQNLSETDCSNLSLANKKFYPIAKHQLLNIFFQKLIKQNFEPKTLTTCQALFNEAKKLKIFSEDKNNAIRHAIASFCNGFASSSLTQVIDDNHLFKDQLLSSMVFTKLNPSILDYPRFIGTIGKTFHLGTVLSYLIVLKENKLQAENLYLEIYSKMDKKMAQAIVEVINNNKSISKLDLYFQNWDASILNKIMEAVNKSEYINEVIISDLTCNDLYDRRTKKRDELLEVLENERNNFLTWFNNEVKDSLSNIQNIQAKSIFHDSSPAVHVNLSK